MHKYLSYLGYNQNSLTFTSYTLSITVPAHMSMTPKQFQLRLRVPEPDCPYSVSIMRFQIGHFTEI